MEVGKEGLHSKGNYELRMQNYEWGLSVKNMIKGIRKRRINPFAE
jgi:hypothetical protein